MMNQAAVEGESTNSVEISIGDNNMFEQDDFEDDDSQLQFEESTGSLENYDQKLGIMTIIGAGNEIQTVDVYENLDGVTARRIEELENLYYRHSRVLGFAVRKSTSRRDRSNELTGKYLVCACQGRTNSLAKSPLMQTPKRKRKENYVTRTGCKARIFIKLGKDGLFTVHQHVTTHNHELTRTKWQYLHRSERKIGLEKGNAIAVQEKSGMKPSDGYRYMVAEAGGTKQTGHLKKDHINFVYRMRLNEIQGGDAQALIDLLTQQNSNEENFFFRVMYDDMTRISAVFWRDSMMAEDFEIYGDLLVLDTTYRTNKYNLICAPFTGLNNHRLNVMFGCAFIKDETTETFVWLLQMFKLSMENKEPVTIFTDQDQALTNAIEEVYPSSRHRLCIWHIKQNAMSHYGNLRSDSEFVQAFDKCLMWCRDEEEFEEEWTNMIRKFKLEKHAWFNRLYTLKDKWCTALNKDYFSARMLSSQRSESTNAAVSHNTSKNTTLVKFYQFYNRTVQQWRETEVQKEFYCSKAKPRDEVEGPAILQHAARVYTHTIYKDFKVQWDVAMASNAYYALNDGDSLIYKVIHEKSSSRREESVLYTPATENKNTEILCSCRHFEEVSLLCGHCLRVLHLNNETRIPDDYISLRWSKMAKMEVWDKETKLTGALQPQKLRDSIPWRLDMMRKLYNLVLKSEGSTEARTILEESFNRNTAAINAITPQMLDASAISESSTSKGKGPVVLDPEYTKTKGRSKRAKSAMEKKKQNGPKVASKPTNPRLF